MKAVVSVLQAVLIFAIAASLVILFLPVIFSFIQNSIDISESSSVRQQLELCNDKILETARTGTQSTCTFSIQSFGRGGISLKNDGIYYNLTSEAEICDQTDWVEITPEKHVWLKCDLQDSRKIYQLRWSSPNEIIFELGDRQTGSILEMNRRNVTTDRTYLFVNFR